MFPTSAVFRAALAAFTKDIRLFDDDAVSVRAALALASALELEAAFLAVLLSVTEVPEPD